MKAGNSQNKCVLIYDEFVAHGESVTIVKNHFFKVWGFQINLHKYVYKANAYRK